MRVVICAYASIGTIGVVRAQAPGGIALPSPIETPGVAHGEARISYFLASNLYRFQGDYRLTYNFTQIRGSSLYAFGDLDVEILSNLQSAFQPDRQIGTFELGVHRLGGLAPLTAFVRHQSPHNLDRSDRKQGSWDMLGLRLQKGKKDTQFTLSLGPYFHRAVNNYQWDLDAQARVPLGRAAGHRFELLGDLHGVAASSGGSSFVDCWLEPSVALKPNLMGYVGAGTIHDADVFGGRTETPVVVGVKLKW